MIKDTETKGYKIAVQVAKEIKENGIQKAGALLDQLVIGLKHWEVLAIVDTAKTLARG